MLEKLFKLQENGTNVKTEVIAGITTFMTMAYILAVNPSILSASGMDSTAVLMATALASFVGCIAMALLANYPFALAPGLGLNAYFAYTVCGEMGYSWQFALMAIFIEGLIFIVLSLTNVREAIFNAIPTSLKKGVSVGIGLFVTFIALQNAGFVVNSDSTLVTVVDPLTDLGHTGIPAILSIVGLFVIVTLKNKGLKGSILWGILITWLLGIVCQLTGIYQVDPSLEAYSLLPSWSAFSISSIGLTFGQCFNVSAFGTVKLFDAIVIIFAFLFVDMFDTIGTLVGVSSKAGMLDKDGKLPRVKQALLADAIATSAGAILGTSTTTTFVESSSGVSEGGRTGLSSVVTGILFLLAIFFAPIYTAIPSFATAPALLYVGFLMMSSVCDIDFTNLTESVPAFLCIIGMPFMYSISEGIALGVISYVVINLATGKLKKITPLMYILAVLFVIHFLFL